MTLFVTGTYQLTVREEKIDRLTSFYKYLSLPFDGPYSLSTLNSFLKDFITQQLNKCYCSFAVPDVMISSWKEYNPDGIIAAKDDEILEISEAEYAYYDLPYNERSKICKEDFIAGFNHKERG